MTRHTGSRRPEEATTIVRCTPSAHEERVRLLHAAQEIRSIVETASFDRTAMTWRRGTVTLELSGPTFTMTGSRHSAANQRSVFQVTLPAPSGGVEDPWAKALRLAESLVEALTVLRAQDEDASHGPEPAAVMRVRSVLCAAATLKGFASYDVVIQAPCPGRHATAIVHQDGPDEWTLRPDVETRLLEEIPPIVAVDHTGGLDMVLLTPWQHEEAPDDDAMEALRGIASCDVARDELELRADWGGHIAGDET